MNHTIKDPPEFTDAMRRIEMTDAVHADTVNEPYGTLINNDVYLKAMKADRSVTERGISSAQSTADRAEAAAEQAVKDAAAAQTAADAAGMAAGNAQATADQAKSAVDAAGGVVPKITSVDAVLTAAGWDDSTKQQTVTIHGMTLATNAIVGLANNATDEQRTMAAKANIQPIGQGDNSMTVKCMGSVPAANMPITVLLIN